MNASPVQNDEEATEPPSKRFRATVEEEVRSLHSHVTMSFVLITRQPKTVAHNEQDIDEDTPMHEDSAAPGKYNGLA